MPDQTPPDPRTLRAMRHEMHEADNQKLARIAAVLDAVADSSINEAVLEPLRARLAAIKPPRPLRFARLLFTPLDPLIVPVRNWRPGQATVPRTVLAAFADVVRAHLGSLGPEIDARIAERKTDAVQVITAAGQALWPRAAAILAREPAPRGWADTGLPTAQYEPLAHAIATVLRRAPPLRALAMEGELGIPEPSVADVAAILTHAGEDPPEGCAMLARLLLLQSPHAAPQIRQFVAAMHSQAQRAVLQHAMAQGIETVLDELESGPELAEKIGTTPLADLGTHVRRMTTLIDEIETSGGTARNRHRLATIRGKLGAACRERFTREMRDGVIGPLAAAVDPVAGATQIQLETRTRELRSVEAAARKVGDTGPYGVLLGEASQKVRTACGNGALTRARAVRLLEILAGPEEAHAFYRS